MKENKEIIEVLDDLIRINNDRIEGYQKAVANIEPSDVMLKTLFYQIAQESHDCKKELAEKVAALGGQPTTEESTTSGKIYRMWMDVKATFSGNDTLSILKACEYGEDAAQKAYKDALKESEDFPEHIREIIMSQKSLLKMSHDLIRNHRDQYSEGVEK